MLTKLSDVLIATWLWMFRNYPFHTRFIATRRERRDTQYIMRHTHAPTRTTLCDARPKEKYKCDCAPRIKI